MMLFVRTECFILYQHSGAHTVWPKRNIVAVKWHWPSVLRQVTKNIFSVPSYLNVNDHVLWLRSLTEHAFFSLLLYMHSYESIWGKFLLLFCTYLLTKKKKQQTTYSAGKNAWNGSLIAIDAHHFHIFVSFPYKLLSANFHKDNSNCSTTIS